MPQVESIQELRRRVQAPVEAQNDLSGRLYGSRVSIFITRFFLARGWHANVATALMIINGLLGAGLLVFPGWGRAAGFFLLVTYYLFDCVDGEIARYHGISHLKAAYVDYLAHLVVKSATFLCLGIGLAREAGAAWPFYLALAPTLALLFTKIVADVPGVLFAYKLLLDRDEALRRNFWRWRRGRSGRAAGSGAARGRSPLGLARELVLNFDVALLLFLLAAFADLVVPRPANWPAWCGFAAGLFLFYAVALPLNLVDLVVADLRTERLLGRVDELVAADRRRDTQPPRAT